MPPSGDWQGFFGVVLTLATAIVACASWINNRFNSLLREILERFDGLEDKYATKESLDAVRSNSSERHQEHGRRITRLELSPHVAKPRIPITDDSEA